jgi:hypothetical protein
MGNLPEWNEVILTIDLCEFRVQSEVHAEPGECFEVAAQSLRGRVEDTVRALRVIESVAEGSIRTCKRPVRRFPRVWVATDTKDQAVGFDTERDTTTLRPPNLRFPTDRLTAILYFFKPKA